MDINIKDTIGDKEGSKKETVRSKDLATRERVNFVVSSEIMQQLRAKSSRDQIPMSRIIDIALQNYLANTETAMRYASLATGIAMSHLFELLLLKSYQSAFTETISELVSTYFENFIYSRCAFKTVHQQAAIMGTKFLLFLRDEDDEKFTEFLSEVNKVSQEGESESIRLLLDGKPISY